MPLANQATPAAFPHILFNQSSVRVESLICLSRLICSLESKCVKVFFFTILSRQETNSRPAVQEDISNPALVWSDHIHPMYAVIKLYCRYCTEVACMFILSLFLVQFFSTCKFLPKFVWGNISCVGVDGGLDTFIHSLRRITIEGTYPDMLSCTWKMFINNNIHQAQIVHITLLGEEAEQNKFHPTGIFSRNSLTGVSTIQCINRPTSMKPCASSALTS